MSTTIKALKGYLSYKTITFQNVLSEVKVKFFYFVERSHSILKLFKFLYFQPSHDLRILWSQDEY